uniref:Uncharacterized protein n=1 Tax=Strongyloides stercoralis TaxID=6248 RepID=A0A0K0EQW4_STRER
MANSPATPSFSTPSTSKSSLNSNERQFSKTGDYFQSSKSSSSTLSKNEILELKCRLVNVKKQLKERERIIEELNNKTTLSDAIKDEEKNRPYLNQQVKILTEICEKLLKAVQEGGEADNQRLECMENLYSEHIEELTATIMELRFENNELKKLNTENGGKVVKIINENEYLREHTKYLEEKVSKLTEDIEKEAAENKRLKLEFKKQEVNQRQLNSSHANRLKEEIIAAKHECSIKMENVRISAEDKIKEQELKIKKLTLNSEMLINEIYRKEDTIEKLSNFIEKLLEQKKQGFKELSNTTEIVKKEAKYLKNENVRLDKRLREVEQQYKDLENAYMLRSKDDADEGFYSLNTIKSQLLFSAREQQLEKDRHIIEKLQKQVEDLKKIPHITNIQKALVEKSVKIRELEQNIKLLTDELLLEREQRETATCLLAEMTKDMKVLCGEKK